MASSEDNLKVASAVAMVDNLVKLDDDIRAAIKGCFSRGNISFVAIIGLLEKHKHAVLAESNRQEELRVARAAKTPLRGAAAQ